jgi:quercetin dioxygenase-like cupin family protein
MKTIRYLAVGLICLMSASAIAETKPEAKFTTLAQSDEMWDGTDLPAYPKTRPQITVQKVTLAPKGVVPWHKHPTILACYVVSGDLTVTLEDGEELKAGKGEAFIEVVNKWHMGKNIGTTPVELIVFYAGTKGLEHTVLRTDSHSK